ncbi:MAG: Hsp33 family molecular chaperone [bacterium]
MILDQKEDFILPFQVGESNVRGKLIRLGKSVDQILSAHGFLPPLAMLTGEAAALVAMLGCSLKFKGKLILQLRGDGPVSMIVADFNTKDGSIRATASYRKEKASIIEKARGPELHYLLAKGQMVVTVDQGTNMDRFQGVTALEGPDLATAAVNYFKQSEQIPTAVKLSTGTLSLPGKNKVWRAGGIMIQHIPAEGGAREKGQADKLKEEEQEAWDNALALMQTVQDDELLDPSLPSSELLYRLFHENGVRVFDAVPVQAKCECSREKVAAVLDQYKAEDLSQMAEDGVIKASCDFCRAEYEFPVPKQED